jgi:hypothetical protein
LSFITTKAGFTGGSDQAGSSDSGRLASRSFE